MASGSGRYQSKVFSFFSQQSLRWRDRVNQTLRQAQVAALWGLQILLYPIYTTFQTTRLVGRQIGRSVQQIIPQLQAAPPSLSSDTPLQHTLAAVETLLPSLSPLGLEEKAIEPLTETALMEAASVIQGIASQLDSHHLVLVTENNQILDILPAEQQTHLQRQIVWELADYWRQQRFQQRRFRGRSTSTLLPLVSDHPKAWLPIRVFYRLMAWMQMSPVALATNLFQESQSYLEAVDRGAIAALPSSAQNDLAMRSATPTWSSLDELFGDFLPSTPATSGDPQVLSRLQTSLVEIAQRSARFASQLLQKSGIVLYAPPAKTTPTSPRAEKLFDSVVPSQTPVGIEQLRQKFFDRLNAHLQVQEPILGTSPENLSTATQPTWETFDPTQSRALVPSRPEIERNITSAGANSIRVPVYSTPASITSATEEYPGCAIVPQPVATPIQPVSNESEASGLAAPTYIEAEVKLVKYVKHPLEQVLEWLDLGMLWIENRLAAMVKWISDRLR